MKDLKRVMLREVANGPLVTRRPCLVGMRASGSAKNFHPNALKGGTATRSALGMEAPMSVSIDLVVYGKRVGAKVGCVKDGFRVPVMTALSITEMGSASRTSTPPPLQNQNLPCLVGVAARAHALQERGAAMRSALCLKTPIRVIMILVVNGKGVGASVSFNASLVSLNNYSLAIRDTTCFDTGPGKWEGCRVKTFPNHAETCNEVASGPLVKLFFSIKILKNIS